MINGLLIWGASYKSKKWVQALITVAWIAYMLINYNFSNGYLFPIVNTLVVFAVMYLSNFSKKVNPFVSAISVLMYSVIVDIICFYLFPAFSTNLTIFEYIFNGILFNYKAVLLPVAMTINVELFKAIMHATPAKKQELKAQTISK